MISITALVLACAPMVAPQTFYGIVAVESSFNPFAIGVVNGRLPRQPESLEEAIATAHALSEGGWNYSVGLAQINVHNLDKYNLTIEQAFEPCSNLRVGSEILAECYSRHPESEHDPQKALVDSLSCYYSGCLLYTSPSPRDRG